MGKEEPAVSQSSCSVLGHSASVNGSGNSVVFQQTGIFTKAEHHHHEHHHHSSPETQASQPWLLQALRNKQKILWNAPVLCQQFIDRPTVQASLTKLGVQAHENASVKLAVCRGLGGVGKSTLVRYYAEHLKDYSIRIWFRAEDPAVLLQDYLRFADYLGYEGTHVNLEEVKSYVSNILQTHSNWLLVFDSVSSYQAIEAYVPQGSGVVLLTSCESGWSTSIKMLEIGLLSTDEAVTFLKAYNSDLDSTVPEVGTLVKTLAYLPGALARAGVYMKEKKISAEEYLALLRQHAAHIGVDKDSLPGVATVATANQWHLTFERLPVCSFLANRLFEQYRSQSLLTSARTINNMIASGFVPALVRILYLYPHLSPHFK